MKDEKRFGKYGQNAQQPTSGLAQRRRDVQI